MADELGGPEETQSDEPSPPPTWWHTYRGWFEGAALVLVLALVAFVVTGIVIGGSDDDPPRSASRPSSTSQTTLSPEAEVEQAYRGFDAMLARLNPAPDPDDPEIAQRTTGEFRAQIERVMADRRARRLAVRTGPDYGPREIVTTVSGESATLQTCYVDQAAIVNVTTGAEVNAMRSVTEHQTLTFVREGGAWKLRRLVIDHDAQPGKLPDCKR